MERISHSLYEVGTYEFRVNFTGLLINICFIEIAFVIRSQ